MCRIVGKYNMIDNKIKNDVIDEFEKLKENLQAYLKPDFDVLKIKQFLRTYIPKEIVHKSDILLDTLLNYLIEDARKRIRSADTKLQNTFFDADFRKRVHEWTKQLENKLVLEPHVVRYSSDPRLKQGLIASGVVFAVGAGVTAAALAPSIVGTIIGGIVTILLSVFTLRIVFERAAPEARISIKADIDQYLKESQKQVLTWLEKVETNFENNFHDFCSTNGFKPKVT